VTLLVASAAACGLLAWRAARRRWDERWSALGTVAAAYVLASVLFHWQLWLLPGVMVPRGGGDLVSFLYPTYAFAAAQLQAGRLPYWNPHLFGGAPFAADLQSGIFYPPNLAAFLTVRPFTYEVLETLAALHYALAGLTTYALARELGLPRLGAFAAGLVFAFSGFMVAHLGHYNMLAAASWSPLVLALLIRALRLGRVEWAVLGGGAFALVLLAGHTQTALYLALALGLTWLLALTRRPGPVALASLPSLLVVGATAAAVLLLPAFELTRLSIRSDISYAQAAEFAASPLGLVTFVVPKFFGDSPNDYWGLRWSLQESFGYVGVSGLVLAASALWLRRAGRLPGLLLLFALFWLVVALGETTPLHGWLYRLVPGFDKVRAPGRGLLFADLALALLVGLGVARLALRPTWRDRARLRAFMRSLLVVAAGIGLVAVPLLYYAALTSQDKDPTILRRALQASGSVTATFLFLVASVALLWRWRRLAMRWVSPAAVGLVALDLAVAGANFNPTTDDLLTGFRQDQLVAFLRQGVGDGRIDLRTGVADVVQPDLPILAGLDDVSGLFNPLTLRSFDRYWESLGSRSVPGYDLLAVKYVVAKADAPLDAAKFQRVFEAPGGLGVFENGRALPRAFVAPRGEVLDEAGISARLRDPAFDPRAVALLDDQVVAFGGGDVAGLERPSPNEVIVRLRDVRGGYLVVSEVLYPGWRAAVDGAPAPVFRAYNLLMAVPIREGAREVRLSFRPNRWELAVALSAVGWMVVAGGAVLALRRRGPPPLAGVPLWS
jgi:hypothetical protein